MCGHRSPKESLFSKLIKLHAENKNLRESFNKVFHTKDMLIVVSTITEGRIVEANDVFFETIGYSREEVIGKTSFELDLFPDFEVRQNIARMVLEKGKVKDHKVRLKKKSGIIVSGSFSGDIISINGQSLFIITARKFVEEGLHISCEKALVKAEEVKEKTYEYTLNDEAIPSLDDIISLKKSNKDEKEYYRTISYLEKCNNKYSEYIKYLEKKIISG